MRPESRYPLSDEVGARLEGEGVRAGAGLAERIGADSVGREAREPAGLLRVCGPATQRVDDERIVHIDQDGNSGIDCGDGFDRQDGVKEAAAGSAEGFGGLDPRSPNSKSCWTRSGASCWSESMLRTKGSIFS